MSLIIITKDFICPYLRSTIISAGGVNSRMVGRHKSPGCGFESNSPVFVGYFPRLSTLSHTSQM